MIVQIGGERFGNLGTSAS